MMVDELTEGVVRGAPGGGLDNERTRTVLD